MATHSSRKFISRREAFETDLTFSNSKPHQTSPKKPAPTITPPSPSHAAQTVPTETSEERLGDLEAAPEPTEIDENAQCFICAEPITFWSVGVCGHRTCHVCAIRLRIFYKNFSCTFCKTSLPSLLFSRSPSNPLPTEHHITPSPPNRIAAALANADKLEKGERRDKGLTLPGLLDLGQFPFNDEKLGVVFEDEDMMEVTLLLLRFNCPYTNCPHMASSWDSLERHTLSIHGLVLCSLCRRQLSRFAHEQVLYPLHLLALHDPSRVQRGQRPPRPRGDREIELVKGWDAPHPMCEFCHEAFFGPDELFSHMRTKHEECFVCRQLGEKDVYFQNYPKLEAHFNSDHYPCMQPVCLEKKFQVFPSEMDLRAHMVSEHGEQMSARDRAHARLLPIGFNSQNDSSRRNGPSRSSHSGRGYTLAQTTIPNNQGGLSRGREAPPHQQQIAQPLPMVPAQAAQQRRQIQADRQEESLRKRAFVTSLTGSNREEVEAAAAPAHVEISGSGYNTPREDVDEATADQHAEILSRVSMLVGDSSVKLLSFRSAFRQFQNHESRAKDMIDTVYNVLDRDTDATMGVVREVAGLFHGEGEKEKQASVLEALNGFRVEQREQFPALNVPTGHGSDWAGITSGKILNAKRVTQTGRGGSSRVVWDRVEAAAASHPANRPANSQPTVGAHGRHVPGSGSSSSTSAFPNLGAQPGGLSRNATPHSTAWSSGGAGTNSKSPPALTGPIIRSVNFPVPAPTKVPPSQNAFPSLPTNGGKMTAAERQALFNKPNAREESIKRITGQAVTAPPPVSGWGSVANGVETMRVADAAPEVEDDRPAGKKKGKGKQLLFTVSGRPS